MNIIPKRVSLGLLATVTSLATHVSPVKADIMQNIRPRINGVGQHTLDLNRDTFQRISNFACRLVKGTQVLEGPYLLPEKTEKEAEVLCDEFANNLIRTNGQTPNLDRVEGVLEDLGNQVPPHPDTY